jgi:hypothetical protein
LPTITHSHPPHSLPGREFHHWRHFEAMRRPVDNSRLLVSVASVPMHQPTPPQAGSLTAARMARRSSPEARRSRNARKR